MIGLVVMINVLLAGLLQTPMGYAADRYNKKYMVTAGGILAIGAILLLDLTHSFWGLLFANSLFGIGGGISLPAIMALGVIEGRKSKAMGSIMGLLAQAHSLGMLLGPLIGGLLLDFASFRVVFLAGALIMCFGTLAYIRMYNEPIAYVSTQ